jgi:hypothetical protein
LGKKGDKIDISYKNSLETFSVYYKRYKDKLPEIAKKLIGILKGRDQKDKNNKEIGIE